MAKKEILYYTGELDVLPYYSRVSKVLKNFLKNKEIASKVHLPNFFFLRRGSKDQPLYIKDFDIITKKMIELRKHHLGEIRKELTGKQRLIWRYFPPRKLVQFFYATNQEVAGKLIERIFIDIDRKKHSADKAKKVTRALVGLIKKDKDFNRMLKVNKLVVLWTGSSFHILVLLKKEINLELYNEYLSYGEKKEKSFMTKWADRIEKETKIPTRAGHEKSEEFIVLDSSNTPSGKLARAPFSLHVKDWRTYDGICLPISVDDLDDSNLIKRLSKLTPDDIIKNLNKYKNLL